MCGFTGFLSADAIAETSAILPRMLDTIERRGPDDAGYWMDPSAGIALGHRRLAILDLSAAGFQPMASSSGRFMLAFNGEIYNHLDLRLELQRSGRAPKWRGHSDTETLTAGFDAWGVQATIEKCVGMFAFGLWDKSSRMLTLGRDRLGEKPLYYGWQGQGGGATFLFGSELRALKAHPVFDAVVDRSALTLLLRYGYIPAPFSIYAGISKLRPGCLLTLSLEEPVPKVVTYWSGQEKVKQGLSQPFVGSPEQAVDSLEILLKDSVRGQMMADVPLGAFLSGGVDSSTIVALMQTVAKEQGGPAAKTFTIGFDSTRHNEAEYAKAVAGHLGTDHTELYVSSKHALDIIPKLPSLYSEPFADSSQIPTFLVSEMARSHVTVTLSGDAGDELFGGYTRYVVAHEAWKRMGKVPSIVRSAAARTLTGLPVSAWNRLLTPVQGLLSGKLAGSNLGDKIHKGAALLDSNSPMELYRRMVSSWVDPSAVVIGGVEPCSALTESIWTPDTGNFLDYMMELDMLTYLPDDILCKVDRAAMGVSLETRVPMLDHRVVEFAWTLPQDYKVRNGVGKWPLRELLYRHVPRALIERSKMGFGIPLDVWLRGPLRIWAEELLSEARLLREGYFHPAPIRKKWAEHLGGQRNWAHYMWPVLMFQAWLDEQ